MARVVTLLLLLSIALAAPSSAQQAPMSTDGGSGHALIRLDLGSLDIAWRSVGANRWETKAKDNDGAWVAFPPAGTEIRYCYCVARGGAVVFLRAPQARQEEIVAFAKQIAWTYARSPSEHDLPAAKDLRSDGDVLIDAFVGPRESRSSEWPVGTIFLSQEMFGHYNSHFRLRVPSARLDEAFAVIGRSRLQELGSTKF